MTVLTLNPVFLKISGICTFLNRDGSDLPVKSSHFPDKYFFLALITELGPSWDGEVGRHQRGPSLIKI